MRPSRRQFLTAAAGGAASGVVGCIARTPAGGPLEEVPDRIGLETVVDGLDAPLAVAFAPEADRRYVAERDGRVLVHGADGLADEPALDLRDTVRTAGEQGLLGMALHPDFARNRRLFVRYSGPLGEGMPEDHSHAFVLAEFEVSDDGQRVPRESERTVLEFAEPREMHNGGDLAFGPDGYLYVTVGDSGESDSAQNVSENLLGSLLRIDVDAAAEDRSEGRAYAVPEDNPLVGREGRDEYYAWGFRNPWRLSFDGEDCYVADVGQNRYEEVNRVERGGNYGWNVKEGTHCFNADDCPDETPADVRGGEPFVDPVVEYPHGDAPVSGVSITGGYVSRGSALPTLEGSYVFGDFVPEGRLFVAAPTDPPWPTAAVDLEEPARLTRLLSFGRDRDGAVYALGTGDDGGGLFRLTPAGT